MDTKKQIDMQWVVYDPTVESIIPAPVSLEDKIGEWILKSHLPEIPKPEEPYVPAYLFRPQPAPEPKPEPKPEPQEEKWYRPEYQFRQPSKVEKPEFDWGTFWTVAAVVGVVLAICCYGVFLFGMLVLASGLSSLCISAN